MIAAAPDPASSTAVLAPAEVSVRRPGVSAVHQRECEGYMSNSVRDHNKMKARVTLLTAQPSKKLTVDTGILKGITSFDEFLCHAECSIARGEAIEGSDIDMGLVVSKTPIPSRQQVALVAELRAQGFVVFHPSELHRGDPSYPEKALQVIKFKTHTELKSLYKQHRILYREVQCYIAGYRIDSDSDRPTSRHHRAPFGRHSDLFDRKRKRKRAAHTKPDFGSGSPFSDFSEMFDSNRF